MTFKRGVEQVRGSEPEQVRGRRELGSGPFLLTFIPKKGLPDMIGANCFKSGKKGKGSTGSRTEWGQALALNDLLVSSSKKGVRH